MLIHATCLLHPGDVAAISLVLACCCHGDDNSQSLLLAFQERLLELLQHTRLPSSALLLDERVCAQTRSQTRS